MNMLD
jgi:hypothetical protein